MSNDQLQNLASPEAIELWKHFLSTGGTDKDRMITIVNLLLGFSATIFGYFVTAPAASSVLAVLGILISGLAIYIVVLYRAHAYWNWAKAECLVKYNPVLRDLVPPGDTPKGRAGFFKVLLFLTCSSLIVHLITLVWVYASFGR
jgi:hypothetical protein